MIPIEGVLRPYAWGSTTAIPALLGVEASGEPAAELWFGAHPDAPSQTADGPLDALIAKDPEAVLGAPSVAAFGPRLPFLLKILAAESPLSLQVHPSPAQAAAGYRREDELGIPLDAPERNYRDRSHKPELLCALTPVDALCSFRRPERTARLFRALGLQVSLDRGIRDTVAGLFEAPGRLAAEAADACARYTGDEWRAEAAWGARIGAQFPGDVGLVLALMLNLIRLAPGQAIYLGAGQIHAYLHGTGVEIMAASDNVLRCGLTPKHVDVAEVLAVASFAPVELVPLEPDAAGRYRTPAADFALRHAAAGTVLPPDGARIVLTLHPPAHGMFVPAGEAVTLDKDAFVASTQDLPQT